MKILEVLLNDLWYGTVFLAISTMVWGLVRDLDKSSEEARDVIEYLRRNEYAFKYRYLVSRALDFVDRLMYTREAAVRPLITVEEHQFALLHNKNALCYGSLDLSIGLALAYPTLSIFVQGLLGAVELPPYGTPLLDFSDSVTYKIYLIGQIAALGLLVNWTFDYVKIGRLVTLQSYFSDFFLVRWQAFAYFVSLSLSIALGYIFSFVSLGFFAFIVVFSIASAFVASSTFAVAYTLTNELSLTLPIVVVVSTTLLLLRRAAELRLKNPIVILMLLIIAANISAIIVVFKAGSLNDDARRILLMFVFLPTLNGLADFFSLGITRACLRRGLEEKMMYWAIFDGVMAISMIIFLSILMVTFITIVGLTTDVYLVDLEIMFGSPETSGSIMSDPTSYWWLYLTLGTPVIPTAIHLFLAIGSVVLTAPMALRLWIADCIESGLRGRNSAMRTGILALSATIGATATTLLVGAVVVLQMMQAILPDLVSLIVTTGSSYREFIVSLVS
jgi:hypothetical protein